MKREMVCSCFLQNTDFVQYVEDMSPTRRLQIGRPFVPFWCLFPKTPFLRPFVYPFADRVLVFVQNPIRHSFFAFFFSLILPCTTQDHSSHFPSQSLPRLQNTPVGGDEHALAQRHALDQAVLALEPSDDELEVLDGDVDGSLRLSDHADTLEDGLVVPVLEADPEAAGGHVGGGDGFRGLGHLLRGRGRAAAAVEGGEEACALQGEGEVEVVLGVYDGGHAEAGAGGILKVRARVDHVCETHLEG